MESARNLTEKCMTNPEIELNVATLNAAVCAIDRVAETTPLRLARLGESSYHLKLENLQVTGSFKVRGALIGAAHYSRNYGGLVTASTGNFGIALAYAGERLGVEIHVFTPSLDDSKIDAIKRRGATVHPCNTLTSSEHSAEDFAARTSMRYVSPYNDNCMILGAMTVAHEIARQSGNLSSVSHIITPVGGGGLAAGIGSYLKLFNYTTPLVAATPETSTALYNAVHHEKRPNLLTSIADGLVGGLERNSITVDIVRDTVTRWTFVTEEQIETAMRILHCSAGLKVEGAGATALAAALAEDEVSDEPAAPRPVVLVSGSNISADRIARVLSNTSPGMPQTPQRTPGDPTLR